MIEISAVGFAVSCVLAFVGGVSIGFVGAFHLAGVLCDKWANEDDCDEG